MEENMRKLSISMSAEGLAPIYKKDTTHPEDERKPRVANGGLFFKPLSQLKSYRGVLDRRNRVYHIYHDIIYMAGTAICESRERQELWITPFLWMDDTECTQQQQLDL
ncbi:hypothetical protein TEQG_04006 [Trichophyton equinum CBS 127.97]|uniref:Uncharacterized protein n=1 Tax=Trichophyton equinum (strain ATCC MYA-4606 / CBS 127.97) TaxID=559882 RepID=F2PS77_TRIEC|nr:hypothetical protein TEQG_04006 [Trichophyton equinum CBS 127.97]